MQRIQEIWAFIHKLPPLIAILSVAILIISIVYFVRIIYKSRKLISELIAFGSMIRDYARQDPMPAAMRRVDVEALRHALVAKNAKFDIWWMKLSCHLQPYLGSRPVDGVYLVSSSRDALPADELISREFNSDFYHSLPGLVTGAGLAITFTAILMGLYHVSYDPTQVSNPVQGIEGLINNLSGKFASSVVALVCAIGLTVTVKRRDRKLDMAYENCIDAVANAFPRLTEAMILADIQASGVEREKALKNITSDMVDGLRGVFLNEVNPAFSQGVFNSLDPNLRALNQTLLELLASIEKMEHARQERVLSDLRAALDAMHESLVHSLGNIGTDFRESLGQAARLEFERVQSALAGSANLISQMNDSFSQTQDVFGSSLKDFYSQARVQMEQWLNPLENATKALNEAGSGLRETGDRLRPLMMETGNALERMQETLSSAIHITEGFAQSESQIRSHIQANGESVRELAQVQERTNATLLKLEGIQAHSAQLLQGYQSTMGSASEAISTLDKDLSQAFAVIHEGLKAWAQSADSALRQFTTRSNDHLSIISRSLGAQLEILAEKLEEMNDVLDKFPAGPK